MTHFQRPNIARLEGYVPGEQIAEPTVIKLNTNENPYPASPKVEQALQQISVGDLRRYPNPMSDDFRTAAAKLHGTHRDQIIATRGGDELLRLLLTTYVNPRQCVGMTEPTYTLYPVLTAIQDADPVLVPLKDDWSLPDNFVERVNRHACALTFIVNPHAPTGGLIGQKVLERIATSIQGILVIDEAYVDFTDDPNHDLVQWAVNSTNVVLLRTLSKGYGLAGLRFGYGIGPHHLIAPMLYKTKDSYNLDAIGQTLATAAINDQPYAQTTWRRVIDQRNLLSKVLTQMGLNTISSQANFVLATIPDSAKHSASEIYQLLKQQHILVRHFDHDRLRDKLRITVGTEEENAALIQTLTKLL